MQYFRFYQLTFILILLLFPIYITAQIENLNLKLINESVTKPENSKDDSKSDLEAGKVFDEENLIHSGDLVDVDILGSTEFDWRGNITPEGFLSGLNFVETINVRCLTADDLSAKIAEQYQKFLRDPKVQVKILDRSTRPFSTMVGEIKIQQKYQLKRKIYLNELIIISGGLTDRANGEIQILRQPNNICITPEKAEAENTENVDKTDFINVSQKNNNLKVINIKILDMLAGEKEANPQILYGDVITVKGAEPVYVIGGVNNPGKILFRSDLSVSRSIAAAGGFTAKAKPEKIRVFRRENNETNIIELNLEQTKVNEKDDILLKPYDIVEVSGKGDERRFSPLNDFEKESDNNTSKLPLRVID